MAKAIRRNEEEKTNIFVLAGNLILAYIITVIMLLILAFLLYKLQLSEKTVSICMIVIYVGATFLAGFLNGRKMKKMKYMWGVLLGLAYFLILTVISLISGRAETMFGRDFFTTLLLCSGGGMLGGMMS